MPKHKLLFRPCLFLLALLLGSNVAAHEVRPAYLHIKEKTSDQGDYFEVLWKQPIVQNGRLAIDPVFPEGCQLEESQPPEFTPGALIYRWITDCDLSQGTVHINGLSVTLTDVMVRIDNAQGESANHILRPENPTLDLSDTAAPALAYLVIGIEHLVFGIDHVLFVIGLVLFIHQPWMLFKTITAFTVAHSITLAMSVLGWVSVDQGPVEAIIALSILFLARELVQEEDARSRLTTAVPWAMAFVFGLLHGFGFAGALRDIGLPEDTLWLALLLFNLGIEMGQIMIIAAIFAMSWLLNKVTSTQTLIRAGAYGMGALAAYWTIDRTLILL